MQNKPVQSGLEVATAGPVLPLNTAAVGGAGDEAKELTAWRVGLHARIAAQNQATLEFNAQAQDLARLHERLEVQRAQYGAAQRDLQRRWEEFDAQVFQLARELEEELRSCPEGSDRAGVIAEAINALELDRHQAIQAARIAATATSDAVSPITDLIDGPAAVAFVTLAGESGLVASPNGIVTACDKTARPFS
ncbi:hypothetical protein [Mycobacteroides abscessus]|uniref:hypothetical protein n=1 Tax=Mycobacteroides abscessus TaxID=36809 RepID=UPI0012FFD987|nr:hypothetical protein [Mycobacteroides abscessus]